MADILLLIARQWRFSFDHQKVFGILPSGKEDQFFASILPNKNVFHTKETFPCS
jgi:hypothetical protein